MTLRIEPARPSRRITWLTIVGVILLPVLIGGVLVAALWNPASRLGDMRAAIVNDDTPVTVNGQLAPLGRQLTAGLVEGSDDVESNIDWVISNAEDAKKGLADGTYQAAITIPENFSAAATSTSTQTPQQATIQVQTSPDARMLDATITNQIAEIATASMGRQLSQVYLENVLLGFTELNTKLGEAADGADKLANGAQQVTTGSTALADGASKLADGTGQLGSGARTLADGLDQLRSGAAQASDGVGTIVQQLGASSSQNAGELLGAIDTTASFASTAMTSATTAAQTAGGAAEDAGALATTLGGLAASCDAVTQPALCAELATAAQSAGSIAQNAGSAASSAGDAATAAGTANGYAGGVRDGVNKMLSTIDSQMGDLAVGLSTLQGKLGELAGGIGQAASGARDLGSGADQTTTGATQLASGAKQLDSGVKSLSDGTASLASGLHTAVDQIPTYTKGQAQNIATVVSHPVTTDGASPDAYSGAAAPLLAVLALWFGGLASYIAMQARTQRTLASRAPSFLLALRALAPAAGIGAVQGVLVAAVLQIAARYDLGTFFAVAGIAALIGVAFAAVHQALVAVFGGAGRWVAALVGVLFFATSILSTAPAVMQTLSGLLPTAPAYSAILAAVTSAGGMAGALVGLIVWTVLMVLATTLAVARRRSTSAQALLRGAVPALA